MYVIIQLLYFCDIDFEVSYIFYTFYSIFIRFNLLYVYKYIIEKLNVKQNY